MKNKLLKKYEEDFEKMRSAALEIVSFNRSIDATLVNSLTQDDFSKLEEHIEVSKLITTGIKAFNDMYTNMPGILKGMGVDEEEEDIESKVSLADIINGIESEEDKESEESEEKFKNKVAEESKE